MSVFRLTAAAILTAAAALSATLGTVVALPGGAADLVLDESRGRVYLVNTAQSRLEIYNIATRTRTSVPTDSLPLSAAISPDRRFLYVAAYDASALTVFDLRFADLSQTQARRTVSLPARPEGVAVGGDGRVLISTIGTGQNNQTNVLLIYDPAAEAGRSITPVGITPPPPASPLLPAPSGRIFLSNRSQLQASPDGRYIIGVNLPNANSRAVFVYEVASGTVLRSRTVINASSVLSIAPDGETFMAGLTLFDTNTLQVLAQQNAANSPHPFPNGVNFNIQQNQGGSVFSPRGDVLYSAFNVAPVQNPPARANVSQLLLNDPDNLLIRMGLQLSENLVGKMQITSDGNTIFALSESGMLVIPVGAVAQSPIAVPETTALLLTSDQCGVFRDGRSAVLPIRNEGRGRMSISAQVLQTTPTGPGGIGGPGGPGGGAPGGGVVIVIPDGGVRPGTVPLPPTLPGGGATPGNANIFASAPQIRASLTGEGPQLDFTYTAAAVGRNPGTVSPTHTYLLQSPEAVNIPPAVRVYQNFRNSESRGDILPVQTGLSANEALEDMLLDAGRQRLYIANSGLNRVEVYDIRQRRFLNPIKVGQLPRSLALTPDGASLYVANSGGESISIVDPDRMRVTGRVSFPPLPFNSGAAPITPSVIASGLRGLQIVMNNGTLWKVVGNDAVPRTLSPAIGSTTVPAPRTMAATPNGENVILVAGNGFVYLYDSMADEFIQGRQIFSNPIQGFYGPVTAGPRGQFYVVNGTLLNQSLTPVASAGSVQLPGGGNQQQNLTRPVSAVATGSGSQFVRLVQPVRVNANAAAAEPPQLELVDATTGNTLRSVGALEGPISTVVGNNRVNVNGRTLTVDPSGSAAYAITTSGLSVIPLDAVLPADRPVINPGGTVSLSSYVPAFAPGSLVSIFGRNLGESGVLGENGAPTLLGGACVTINNVAMPLLMTSSGQINAQIPPELAAGRYPVVVRSIERKAASLPQTIQVARYAPSVFADPETKEAYVFRPDGSRVTRSRPAKRDEPLMMYATGLGVTKGGRVTAGAPAPSEPLAVTDEVKLYFGDPTYSQAEIIVDWSGLVPGFVGLYQINLRVPGNHLRGSSLPVLLRIGGVGSQTTGPLVPVLAVD